MLLDQRTSKLHIVPSSRQTAPFLDIEELLENRIWKQRGLSNEEQHLIVDTEKFLQQVLIGQQIAENAVNDRKLSADLVAINAYNVANRAIQLLPNDTNKNLKDVVLKSQFLLFNILTKSDEKQWGFSDHFEDLKIVQDFISALSTVSLSTNSFFQT